MFKLEKTAPDRHATAVSPLMNGFATLAMCLFYFCYKVCCNSSFTLYQEEAKFLLKYLFTFVYDMPKAGETAGRYYFKAIQHFFVGIYIKEICLAGLFFLGAPFFLFLEIFFSLCSPQPAMKRTRCQLCLRQS